MAAPPAPPAPAAPPAPCPDMQRVIVSDRNAAHAARSFVRFVFGDGADDVLTVASELATNAYVHAAGLDMLVSLQRVRDGVLIEVADTSRKPPVPRRAPVDGWSENGRGLAVVENLSLRWGWRPEPWGKTVFAVVPLDGLPQAPAARAPIRAGCRKAAPGD